MSTESSESKQFSVHFTLKIIIGMVAGVGAGLLIKVLPLSETWRFLLVERVLHTGGQIFIHLIMMLVVPVVFLSLVCGSSALGDLKAVGRMGIKTLLLYLLTTALAITLALSVAHFLHIGSSLTLSEKAVMKIPEMLSFHQVLLNMFPKNPIRAMAEGNMLQIIVFAILLGITLASFKDKLQRVNAIFNELNTVFMRLIVMVMKLAPVGVFCLLAVVSARVGVDVLQNLTGYFFTVLLVLLLQLLLVYPIFLMLFAQLNPITFFVKMRAALLFAFSVSSSNASIPIVLNTVEKRLGVSNATASFVIPLGATINMDGTAIMQGVATVFIANAYHVPLGMMGYLTIIGMATLASVGTAGVPGVGLITLSMVLKQVGLPLEGIALIIGVDRLLDMVRTAVNVAGDAMVSCVVANSEKSFDKKQFLTME